MLRRLQEKDVDRMLEWMHDSEVNCHYKFDFASMTREKVLDFIVNSFDEKNQHFAIVDSSDNYLGTVSLKNISLCDYNAEYAIVTRREVWGKGIAKKATAEIIHYAFNEMNLHRVYLNVLEKNVHANKFYKKFGFAFEGTFKDHLYIEKKMGGGGFFSLNWYAIVNDKKLLNELKIFEDL